MKLFELKYWFVIQFNLFCFACLFFLFIILMVLFSVVTSNSSNSVRIAEFRIGVFAIFSESFSSLLIFNFVYIKNFYNENCFIELFNVFDDVFNCFFISHLLFIKNDVLYKNGFLFVWYSNMINIDENIFNKKFNVNIRI